MSTLDLVVSNSMVWQYDSLETQYLEKSGLSIRKIRSYNRKRACGLINKLFLEHGGNLLSVPEYDSTLHRIRYLLGLYDNEVTWTDIDALKARVLAVAAVIKSPVIDVLMGLSKSIDLPFTVFWTKADNNTFTNKERRMLWYSLCQFEK